MLSGASYAHRWQILQTSLTSQPAFENHSSNSLFQKEKMTVEQFLSKAATGDGMASGRRLTLTNPHFYPQRDMSLLKKRSKSAAFKGNSTERLNTMRYVWASRSMVLGQFESPKVRMLLLRDL